LRCLPRPAKLHGVARIPTVPAELRRGPFTLADAKRAGIERWHLRGASWRRVGPRTYVWAGLGDSQQLRLAAAQRRLPPTAAFSGFTAAWLHGLDVSTRDPIEVTVPEDAGVSARAEIVLRRAALPDHEVVSRRGFRTTSILRTLRDLCLRLSLTEAVVVADMSLHLGITTLAQIRAAAGSGHALGVVNLRQVGRLAEPASESPMESRLRMLLVLAGLPRPLAQVPIKDGQGRFLGRPDLLYPDHRLGIEFDGGVHRGRLAEDNRRQNRLLGAGIRLLRFTAGDVLQGPEAVVTQVRQMLDFRPLPAAGCLGSSANAPMPANGAPCADPRRL